jgi:hypothetical protein
MEVRLLLSSEYDWEKVAKVLGNNILAQSYRNLDVIEVFWPIFVDHQTRHMVAFLGYYKMYESMRMPQGVSNSGPMFSRVMCEGLEGVPKRRIGSFVEDIAIYKKTFPERFASLQLVYEDTVSRSLKNDGESIFYPKFEDDINDDKRPVDLLLSKSEIGLGSKSMNDFLFIYPNVAWRDEFGKQFRKPIKVEVVKEVIQITYEDVSSKAPKKSCGRPRKQSDGDVMVDREPVFTPLKFEVWPETVQEYLIHETVSSKTGEIEDEDEVQQQAVMISSQACMVGIREMLSDEPNATDARPRPDQSRYLRCCSKAMAKEHNDSKSDQEDYELVSNRGYEIVTGIKVGEIRRRVIVSNSQACMSGIREMLSNEHNLVTGLNKQPRQDLYRYSRHRELISDRGQEFVKGIIMEMVKLLMMKKLTITPYHPRGHGIVTSLMNGAIGYVPFNTLFEREVTAVSELWVEVTKVSELWVEKLNQIPKEPRDFTKLKFGQEVFLRIIPERIYECHLPN